MVDSRDGVRFPHQPLSFLPRNDTGNFIHNSEHNSTMKKNTNQRAYINNVPARHGEIKVITSDKRFKEYFNENHGVSVRNHY